MPSRDTCSNDKTEVPTLSPMAEIEIPTPEGRKEEKHVGILIAIIAVLMAIVGALGNNAANEMIVGEVKSSNGFAWYQAKRQREYINDVELRRIRIELADLPAGPRRTALEAFAADLTAKNSEYKSEGEEIRRKANAQADEARLAGARNDAFDQSEILLQIAVVFCSLTLLTGLRSFLYLGVLVALAGALLGGRAYLGSAGDSAQPQPASTSTPAASR